MNTLLHPHEAAAKLGISTKQLKELTDGGLVRWINIGLGSKRPTRRYIEADIEAFVEERACQSTKRRVERPMRTTSSYAVVDFQATRDQLRNEKRNASKAPKRK